MSWKELNKWVEKYHKRKLKENLIKRASLKQLENREDSFDEHVALDDKSDDSLQLDGSEDEFIDETEPKADNFLVMKVPTKKSFRNYVWVLWNSESDGF